MEASALRHTPALAARSPLLRLQSDEKLVALIRRGNHGAFEALVDRYNSRLLAFCRHMLGSTEDAEDVLQEVFTAAFNAICADDRPINARPWLYRIARNRCLNHLRRPQHAGQDSMDVFERDGGATTADTVHTREEFRQIVADVQELPESQRTALLLREIDALSYDQIAEAMDTTVPSVKSLLVRARVSLAEAAEARLLTCEEVRLELGQVAEGITRTSAPVRRHLRACERCKVFKRELRNTSRALAAVYPIGVLAVFKKFVFAKLAGAGGGAAAGGAAASSAAAGGAAAGGAAAGGASLAGAGAITGGATAGGMISAGVGAVATKAAAGLAAAAIVTAGAVEVKHASHPAHPAVTQAAAVVQAPPVAEPQAVSAQPQQVVAGHKAHHAAKPKHVAVQKTPAQQVAPAPTTPAEPTAPQTTDQGGSTVTLPAPGTTAPTGTDSDPTATGGAPQPTTSEPAPTTPTDPSQPAPTTTTPLPTSTTPTTTAPPPTPPASGDPGSAPPQQGQEQPPSPPPGE
ncbi:MAG TPA: sigma-70 family RNA polymerase sigma factor [Thermoleophilaceae bacterium]|jgi:RNA polymerase sigma factor (sigma-70 family)